eukprot:3941102-Rhodomonas_salina.2
MVSRFDASEPPASAESHTLRGMGSESAELRLNWPDARAIQTALETPRQRPGYSHCFKFDVVVDDLASDDASAAIMAASS